MEQRQPITVKIPENFDPEIIIPAGYRADKHNAIKDGICYFTSLLMPDCINKKKQDQLEEEGYITLNAQLLHHIIGAGYQEVITLLFKAQVIEVNRNYRVGEQSRGYRLSVQYITPATEYTLTSRGILNRLRNYIKRNEKTQRRRLSNIPHLTKWLNTECIKIDVEGAHSFIEQYQITLQEEMKAADLSQADVLEEEYSIRSKINSMRNSVKAIHEGRFTIHRDSAGRLYTPITGLKRELRALVTLNGSPMGSVDIKASQPYLFLLLLRKEFWQTTKKIPIALYTCYPDMYKKLAQHLKPIIMFLNFMQTLNRSGFQNFDFEKINWEDDFYTHLQQQVLNGDFPDFVKEYFSSRTKVKTTMMLLLYDTYEKKKPPYYKAFKKLYENETELMDRIKCIFPDDMSVFATILQSVEAALVLNYVTRRISITHPHMPILTLHDCILMPYTILSEIKTFIKNEITTLIGFTVGLKIQD